jgi:alkylated DNA repair dioxygenase AlkB
MNQCVNILPCDGEAFYQTNFLTDKHSNKLFEHLLSKVDWQLNKVKVFGKVYDQPRLTCFMGEDNLSYKYSNLLLESTPWLPMVLELKDHLQVSTKALYNCVLLNYYRNGNDSNGLHSDDEKELGVDPTIASISLGQPRIFYFKHKFNKTLKPIKLKLENNTLLLMKGSTQKYWNHHLPKTKTNNGPRINLTFRKIN